jgi:N-methylhydantoinase A/oxoprolinase/acetone carboxylase beta subunit
MALVLGIDTGGTFTDAVVLDQASREILCTFKAGTTHHDVAGGVERCLAGLEPSLLSGVGLVCLSTTLATNAMVEGRGGRAGLLLMGRTLKPPPEAAYFRQLRGRLDIKGNVVERLDEAELGQVLGELRASSVEAVAVSGFASVRNPLHELAVGRLVRDGLGVPVVCAHELSSTLGFEVRTGTALWNARLVPIVDGLMAAVKAVLRGRGIRARLMIMRCDGSLIEEAAARERPIETMLSGPSASVVGGMFLAGPQDAVLVDMGGTTTDVARIEAGEVRRRQEGVRIGGWRTHVQGLEVSVHGFGGDSLVAPGPGGGVRVGPHRVLPLCRAGADHPHLVRELELALRETSGTVESPCPDCFTWVGAPRGASLGGTTGQLAALLQGGPHSLHHLEGALGMEAGPVLERLAREGVVQRASLTPTDLLHAAGRLSRWDAGIARVAVELAARKAGRSTAEYVALTIAAIEAELAALCEPALAARPAPRLVALGAAAPAWLPGLAERLGAAVLVPRHGEVANAVGAAVGEVVESTEVLIRPERETGGYALSAAWDRLVFGSLDEAIRHAYPAARRHVEEAMRRAGSRDYRLAESREDLAFDGVHVETRVQVSARGAPASDDVAG